MRARRAVVEMSAAGGRPPIIGLDFGTTNTVAARLAGDGAQLVSFAGPDAAETTVRSALSFHADPQESGRRILAGGSWAIEAYLEDPLETRLIQSFKTYAASPLFQETRVLGRRYVFEDLLSAYLLQVSAQADASLMGDGGLWIVGRPVSFAGARADDALALARYDAALRRLGAKDVRYAYEPVAAAFFFARRLTKDATVLVGDFGGGTSDFSVMRFSRRAGRLHAQALGHAGVGLAGDAFDYRIIDNLVSPRLGKGSAYRAFGRTLPVPNRYYAAFARWE